MDFPTLNILSLCAGVGGLDLGLRLAVPTARTVCYVEREAYCCEVLSSRMENARLDEAPVWTDLATFDGNPWRGVVDCIIAGLPCQPFSVAGKQQGDADERYIWPTFFRIVREVEPALVFLENVPGILAWFRPIGEELSGMGYELEAGLFTAAEVGASHKRERFFCLAYARGGELREATNGEQSTDFNRSCGSTVAHAPSRGFRECGQPSGGDGQPDGGDGNVGDAAGSDGRGLRLRAEAQQSEPSDSDGALADPGDRLIPQPGRGAQGRNGSGPAVAVLADARSESRTALQNQEPKGRRRISRRGGFPPGPAEHDRWRELLVQYPELRPAISQAEIESLDGSVADGLSERLDALRALGNAVVPRQAAHAFKVLARRAGVIAKKPGTDTPES